MRLLVISSCTGRKTVKCSNPLTVDELAGSESALATRKLQLQPYATQAELMYAGTQHVRLMNGIGAFRRSSVRESELDFWIVSAGYGLIRSDALLHPYECTFSGMHRAELDEWAGRLGIPETFRKIASQKYDLGLVLLGNDYMDACAIDSSIGFGGPIVVFTCPSRAHRLSSSDDVIVVPLDNNTAKRFGCSLVGLKGEIAARLLQILARDPDELSRIRECSAEQLVDLCAAECSPAPARQVRQRHTVKAVPNPVVDHVITIPSEWYGSAHRDRLMYFIPDWDDLVDPDYDFLNDEQSCGTSDWSNRVYAHQLYPSPNYDGILVSRIVAGKPGTKRARVERLKIHRYLRVPDGYPVMGDCGAFGYVGHDEPLYETSEMVDYYDRLGFTYGVSIDHLVFGGVDESDRRRRYNLTIDNARKFMEEYRRTGHIWDPIGAVQGWDPDSYADAAREYVAMGYKYLGIGGLVRTSTHNLIRILEAIHGVVPKGTRMHLFGVARLEAVDSFLSYGVTSIDSASMLRKAWLGAKRNYLTPQGWYSAIRIPQSDSSFRAKRAMQRTQNAISQEELKLREEHCLGRLREFALRRAGQSAMPDWVADPELDDLAGELADYELLFHDPSAVASRGVLMRDRIAERIRRTLAHRPWEQCDCAVCRQIGVEVIIFRGNNRNRRRGFHNTYVFYRQLQEQLAKEPAVRSIDPRLPGFD